MYRNKWVEWIFTKDFENRLTEASGIVCSIPIVRIILYTQLSLKSEVCLVVNHSIQFNVMSIWAINKRYSILVVRLYLPITCVLCLLQCRFIVNSLTKYPIPILNHDPISPKRTRPDTPLQQNELFISVYHEKRLFPFKKLPMCSVNMMLMQTVKKKEFWTRMRLAIKTW